MQIDIEAPCSKNNYQLPLDSPRSPRPNSTVDAVALILDRIIQSNEQYLQQLAPKQPQYKFPRLISAFNFQNNHEATFERLRKVIYNFCYRTRMRNETLVGAILYLDRIVQRSGIIISKQNATLILSCTLLIVQKVYDDFHYSLKDYATVFGVPLQNLTKAEHAYLKLIRYDLIIDPTEYNQYRDYIVQKYDATLRKAFPMSAANSLLQGFQLKQGIASVRQVGEYLASLKNTHQISEDAPVANDEINAKQDENKDDLMSTKMELDDQEEQTKGDIKAIQLPGGRF
ncbi:Cyclin [Spironucleus salmonicida]|uniref:Cyclin n=1 Tax=Spironucleus salmonicida TaxID=348837 RepID=V6LYI2_9EUKA|nr:Cyclin [Spironucleus salmonicida]|eukprot:EST49308.1 Cyclin [Spironucleus salmonicida]